jgi:hypothetical protein
MTDIIGTCIGESSSSEVVFISKSTPRSGEYVILEYDDKKILGMVEALTRGSPSISEDILDPEVVERIMNFEDEEYIRGVVKILGEVETLEIPKIPPPPGTRVYRADSESLKKIFGCGNIKLGRLLSHPDVDVYLDGNKMITRHLAILAITGAGKSNTVSVIVEGILKLNGLPIIFDMHSEYVNADFTGGVNRIAPKLNPLYMSPDEFRILVDVGKDAHVQERYLRKAYREARRRVSEGGRKNFVEQVLLTLEEIRTSEEEFTQSEKTAIVGVMNKVEDFESKYQGLVDPNAPDIIDGLVQGKANVVDLGQVDEDYADVIVSHILRKVLHKRKKGEIPPSFCVLEEAHILAPMYRPTLSKYWIDRIAREGRKFGVGLCLVSQRPKSLDQNSLSQANNSIIMRLVEPSDQRHVQQASERLSDDLLSQLTSLNIGEAVVLGLMTKIPAIVKVDKFEGKLSGGDPDIIGEWQRISQQKNKTKDKERKEIEDLYGNMV